MPDKKKSSSGNKSTGTPTTNSKKVTNVADGNFIVVSCISDEISLNSKFSAKITTKTLEEAENYIKNLTTTKPEYLCILEKKAVYSRKPQIVLTKIK